MPDSNDEEALRALMSRGDKGFSPSLLKVLPRPWDAGAPAEASSPEKPPAKPAPPNYIISPDLAAAAWVALLLRQPLLLTGDPGVGKTRFAEKLAHDLGLDELAVVQVKSTTTGKELLYSFDDLARFRDAAVAGALARGGGAGSDGATTSRPLTLKPVISYVQLQGLGRAIIRAAGAKAPVELDRSVNSLEVFGVRSGDEPLTLGSLFPQEFDTKDDGPRHSIVLVDELDKAPRDTPNDLLAEIEQMSFRFEELGFHVKADAKYKPIVVITSNAERNLPDAFLRRCVFHHIDTPTPEKMRVIAAGRLGDDIDPDSQLMKDATELYKVVADRATEKKPGTAEFIALVAYLRSSGAKPDEKIPMDGPLAKAALRVVTKTNADLTTVLNWLANSARKAAPDKSSADKSSSDKP